MNARLRVYSLSEYPEELVAVAFAKTSRSPEPFDQIARELNTESAAKFHEKWVIAYGHSSVAEHAVVHIAVENASRLAIDILENTRLASYTEKSTRYQVLTKELTYTPELEDQCDRKSVTSSQIEKQQFVNEYRKEYLETIEFLYSKYNETIEKLTAYFERVEPAGDPKKREADIRLKVIDNARFILPNSTYANVGVTVNTRALKHMISKMLSNPLKEVREIGEQMKEAVKKEIPTLIKQTEKNEYFERMNSFEQKTEVSSTNYSVKLVEYENDAEERVIASILYKFSGLDYSSAKEKARGMNKEDREKLIDEYIGNRGKNAPIRELEHLSYTFDLVMDFGAYYEFKRHRMCTPSSQKISPEYGYVMPEDFKKAGLDELFTSAMDKSEECYNKLKEKYPHEAQYVCTNAHKRRTLVTMNLRELYHFIRLRASPFAHFTIQEVAKGMLKELNNVHPLLVKHLRVSI